MTALGLQCVQVYIRRDTLMHDVRGQTPQSSNFPPQTRIIVQSDHDRSCMARNDRVQTHLPASPSSFFLNCNNFVSSLRSIQTKAVLERRLWKIDVEGSSIFSVRSHLRLWKNVEEDIKKLYRHGMGLFVRGNCFSCFLYDKRDRKSTN